MGVLKLCSPAKKASRPISLLLEDESSSGKLHFTQF